MLQNCKLYKTGVKLLPKLYYAHLYQTEDATMGQRNYWSIFHTTAYLYFHNASSSLI